MTGDPAAFDVSSRPILPLLESRTSYFWIGGAEGRLLIARCDGCHRYQYPPFECCVDCGRDVLTPVFRTVA